MLCGDYSPLVYRLKSCVEVAVDCCGFGVDVCEASTPSLTYRLERMVNHKFSSGSITEVLPCRMHILF
jgi:hypothetical protein